MTTTRERVLSGMRPTGKLHLGNYMGALHNWVGLQDAYECYFFIADWHALTTDYADPSRLLDNVYEVALDFLSAGLDPQRCTLFVQSHVPQHAELNLLFGMFTPLSWLERVPTYKDQQEQLREKDLNTYGFLGYPLLQAADILLYQPTHVPVGQDQVSHVELTREVARRFNQLYSPRKLVTVEGTEREEPDPARLILPEPDVLLTPSPKLPGLDGRKMSKSYGNTISLSDSGGDVEDKMSRMSNGGQRNPQSLPGNPDICPVGDMHAVFSDETVDTFIRRGCREATTSCLQCKMLAANGINAHLFSFRQRRKELERRPEQVWDVLADGAQRAGQRAEQTMSAIREVTGLSRTRRPVPAIRQRIEANRYLEPHDISSHAGWWDIEKSLRARNLRDYWLRTIVPLGSGLKQDDERVFITHKNKRAYVATAREEPDGQWQFTARVKSYELLVLLCWAKDFRLHDFVIPQAAFLVPWTKLKKTLGKTPAHFYVTAREGKVELRLQNASPIDITSYRGTYSDLI